LWLPAGSPQVLPPAAANHDAASLVWRARILSFQLLEASRVPDGSWLPARNAGAVYFISSWADDSTTPWIIKFHLNPARQHGYYSLVRSSSSCCFSRETAVALIITGG